MVGMPTHHPQTDLLVIEALVDYHHRRLEEQPTRASYADVLARRLANQHELALEDALRQRTELDSSVFDLES